jgi:16S rRNA (cytosine967-C5)-methyltransferase
VSLSPPERLLAREALGRILWRAEGTLPSLATVLPRTDDNDSRRRLKDVIVGVSVLRLRLAYLIVTARRTSTPPDEAALIAATANADVDTWIDAFLDDDDARDDVAWPTEPVLGLVARRSCPSLLAAMLMRSLGHADADAFLAASNRPGPVTVRTNTLRTTRAALVASLAEDGIIVQIDESTPWAVRVLEAAAAASTTTTTTTATATTTAARRAPHLMASRAWRAGWFEVQDASSQHVALESGATPGAVVVDLCAGRGGKTLALAAMMQDQGRLIAHDPDPRALRDLRGRVGRLGLRCVEHMTSPEAVAGRADIVVVDAPCTSSGVLRRAPDLRFTLTAADVERHRRLQREVWGRAAGLVSTGGRIVYATCSVLSAENDDIVADATTALVPERRRLLLPHRDGGDGFFIASFRRTEALSARGPLRPGR